MRNRQEQLNLLDCLLREPTLDYFELMAQYKYPIRNLHRFIEDPAVKDKVRQVKHRALVKTARELHEVGHAAESYVRNHYYGLVEASWQVYGRHNGRSAWVKILQDAGILIPQKRIWSLKLLFDELAKRGTEPKNFHYADVYKDDSSLVMYAIKKFGYFGKAVVMNGVDYLSLPRIKDTSYSKPIKLTNKDIQTIIGDKSSLTLDEKVRAIFYGLSLQYYPLEQYSSYHSMSIDKITLSFSALYQKTFEGCLDIAVMQRKNRTDMFKTRIDYFGSTPKRFGRTDFNFKGEAAQNDCETFYERIEELLGLA